MGSSGQKPSGSNPPPRAGVSTASGSKNLRETQREQMCPPRFVHTTPPNVPSAAIGHSALVPGQHRVRWRRKGRSASRCGWSLSSTWLLSVHSLLSICSFFSTILLSIVLHSIIRQPHTQGWGCSGAEMDLGAKKPPLKADRWAHPAPCPLLQVRLDTNLQTTTQLGEDTQKFARSL